MLNVALSRMALAGLTAAAMAAVPGKTGTPQVQDDDWCERPQNRDRGWFCEVREVTLDAGGTIRIDAKPNGGIRVEGGSRTDVLVRARVSAQAGSDADAEELVRAVELRASGSGVEADGPRTERRESWSVSYRAYTPARADLDLESTNGGIEVDGVTGDIAFRTTNGGIRLAEVAGNVHGSTQNGGVHVVLTGTSWSGTGLDVRTQNGGVELTVPDGYSAQLETGTVNGGMDFDFPITVEGRLNRRNVSVALGDGGNPIRVRTTNGGVAVRRP